MEYIDKSLLKVYNTSTRKVNFFGREEIMKRCKMKRGGIRRRRRRDNRVLVMVVILEACNRAGMGNVGGNT